MQQVPLTERFAMRAALVLAASLLAAAPALAQERPSAADAARALENPLVQEGAALALVRLADILLDTRVGPLATLADPGVRPDATLRDFQRRDDPAFEARLHRDARRAVRTAGAVAGGAVAAGAELRRTADRLEAALTPLIGALGRQGRAE
jgi:hypothetical protein